MWPVFEVQLSTTARGRSLPRPLQGCYIKALELDEKKALAWDCLGVEGGGVVKGKAYDKKDRWGGGGGGGREGL